MPGCAPEDAHPRLGPTSLMKCQCLKADEDGYRISNEVNEFNFLPF